VERHCPHEQARRGFDITTWRIQENPEAPSPQLRSDASATCNGCRGRTRAAVRAAAMGNRGAEGCGYGAGCSRCLTPRSDHKPLPADCLRLPAPVCHAYMSELCADRRHANVWARVMWTVHGQRNGGEVRTRRGPRAKASEADTSGYAQPGHRVAARLTSAPRGSGRGAVAVHGATCIVGEDAHQWSCGCELL